MAEPRKDEGKLAVSAPPEIGRVLVGLSLDAADGEALPTAVAIAKATGAELRAVHAAEPPIDDWAHPIEPIPVEDVRSRLGGLVEKAAAPAGVAFTLAVEAGPAHRVLDEQRRRLTEQLGRRQPRIRCVIARP